MDSCRFYVQLNSEANEMQFYMETSVTGITMQPGSEVQKNHTTSRFANQLNTNPGTGIFKIVLVISLKFELRYFLMAHWGWTFLAKVKI